QQRYGPARLQRRRQVRRHGGRAGRGGHDRRAGPPAAVRLRSLTDPRARRVEAAHTSNRAPRAGCGGYSVEVKVLRRAWPTLKRDLLFNIFASSVLIPLDLRWLVYRALGAQVAPSRIHPHVWVGSRDLTIGRGTFVNYRVKFNTSGSVT